MGKTSTQVKNRWNKKTYKRVVASLRYDKDKEYLDFIDTHEYSITDYLKAGIDQYMNKRGTN